MNNEKYGGGVFARLLPEIGRAVSEAGYTTPSPIQEKSIPSLLEGRDMIGCAQTGTGKTAAFMLPILQFLVKGKRRVVSKKPRVLILAPTRELAAQIGDSVGKYGSHTPITYTVVFGGVGQNPQVKTMNRGVHVLVATPGRLIDLVNQGHIDLSGVEIFVLDEADRMLDMGFIHDIKRVIAKLPKKRQSLFYSATMEAPVVELSRSLIQNPVHVTIEAEQPAVERIIQKVMFVDQKNKNKLILDVFSNKELDRVIVFTQMKHVANRVCQTLEKQGIRAAAIHGNKGQTARTRALADFKSGKVQALVATDIAARGIDVDSISHVINYDMPIEPETYVHRIGRTARAGADGDAISFCSAAERSSLNEIQKLIRIDIPVDLEHAFHCEQSMNAKGASAKAPSKQQRPSSHRRKTSAASEGRSGQSSGKKRPPHRRKRQSRSRNGGSSGSV